MKWAVLPTVLIIAGLVVSIKGVSVQAQKSQSPKYTIESGTLILQPELEQSSENYDVTERFGQNSKKKFDELGYLVIGNKSTDASERPFIRLKLDKTQLVFDSAELSGESVQKSSVSLLGSGSTNFIVSLRLQEQFKNSFGATIQPTNCDKESSKCTPTLGQIWKRAYGFGYRATGSTEQDLLKETSFRPFFISGVMGKSAVLFDNEVDKKGSLLSLHFKLRPQPQTQTGIYKGTVVVTVSADY